MPERRNGIRQLLTHLELLFVVALWAGTFVSTKIILTQIPPAVAALYRYELACLALAIGNLRNDEKVKREDYPLMVLLGLTGVTLYYLLQHYGIRNTTAMDASLLISLSPVFICILSWIFLREKVRIPTIIGLAISLAGTVLVITGGNLKFASLGERMEGNILILLTAVSWAGYSILTKNAISKYKPSTIIMYSTFAGMIMLVPFSLSEILQGSNIALNVPGWLHMLYLGLAASAYGYAAWNRGLTKLPAITVGSYLYFRPVLTGMIAFLVLGEQPSLFMAAGGVLIIVGTVITARTKSLRKQSNKAIH